MTFSSLKIAALAFTAITTVGLTLTTTEAEARRGGGFGGGASFSARPVGGGFSGARLTGGVHKISPGFKHPGLGLKPKLPLPKPPIVGKLPPKLPPIKPLPPIVKPKPPKHIYLVGGGISVIAAERAICGYEYYMMKKTGTAYWTNRYLICTGEY